MTISTLRGRLKRATAVGALVLAAGIAVSTVSPALAAEADDVQDDTTSLVADAQDWDAAAVDTRAAVAGKTKRSAALARAKTWLTANHGKPVPYSQSKYLNGWRTDCSGYVSMAWNVRKANGNPINHNTDSMLRGGYGTPGKIVHAINWKDIKPGDAIGFLGKGSIGDAGHVMLFEKWADAGHTKYWVYEQAGDGGTHHRTHKKSYNGYKPYRYDSIIDG